MSKRQHLIIFITTLLTVLSSEARNKQLVILHTNDTHSCVMPLNENLADTLVAGRGGFVRRVAMVREQRRLHPDLLLIDSGDFSQGSSYYTLFKGDVEVGLMNLMGYDAVTIGNHEFDFGAENMARLFRMADFPVVCSNYDFTGSPLEGLVKPYITLRRQGVKIGIFAVAPKLKGLVSEQNYQPIKFLNPSEVARQMVDQLRQREKCDLVICISHLGWNTNEYSDNRLIAETRGIDLVLGGHTHTYLSKLEYVNNLDGQPVPVDQNGKHAVFVGKLVLDLQKK